MVDSHAPTLSFHEQGLSGRSWIPRHVRVPGSAVPYARAHSVDIPGAAMTDPLVETKFFPPAPRAGIVARPRLDDRLSRPGHIVLVSAPAGFGKTTLVGRW